MMEPEARYTLVGTVVIVLAIVFSVIIVWLRGEGGTSDAHHFTVYFERQSLNGVQRRGDVTMRGVKVGSITSVRFSVRHPGAVEVVIAVDGQTPVRKSTLAVVERNILTGLATLQLVTSAEDSPRLTEAPPGEPLPVIAEGESRMQRVSDSLDELAAHADATMQSVNATLSPENRAAFAEILDNLRRVTRHADASLAKADAALASVTRAGDAAEALAVTLSRDAGALASRYEGLGIEATSTAVEAREALRRIADDADRVARRADEVLENGEDDVRATVRSLRSASDAVGSAASRVRSPRQAIFGPAPDALGPGEAE